MAFSFSLTLRSCGEWHKQHIFLRRDGRERKKVFAMQKVNVAKISLHLSRRGKYQFSSCLQITYDQNSEWNCLLQENAMMHQPKKAEAGFVLFGTCTHWPQCNFRMLTFLWQIQKSRQFNQWNWVNQKKNKKTVLRMQLLGSNSTQWRKYMFWRGPSRTNVGASTTTTLPLSVVSWMQSRTKWSIFTPCAQWFGAVGDPEIQCLGHNFTISRGCCCWHWWDLCHYCLFLLSPSLKLDLWRQWLHQSVLLWWNSVILTQKSSAFKSSVISSIWNLNPEFLPWTMSSLFHFH